MANTAQTGMDLPIVGRGLLSSLADNWWMLLIRGIAAIAFGILAFVWPGLTLITLTLLWGAYAITDGVFAIWAAFNAVGGDAGPRWWLGIGGVVSILAGIVAFFYTGPATLVLLFSTISNPARTARSAACSCACGKPKYTSMPSPRYCAINPSYLAITAVQASRYCRNS